MVRHIEEVVAVVVVTAMMEVIEVALLIRMEDHLREVEVVEDRLYVAVAVVQDPLVLLATLEGPVDLFEVAVVAV